MAAARVNECARRLTGGCAYLVCQGLADVLHHSAHHPVLIVDLLGVAMQHLDTPPGVFKELQEAVKVSFFFLVLLLLTKAAVVLLLCMLCHGNAICQAGLGCLQSVQNMNLIKQHGHVPAISRLLFLHVLVTAGHPPHNIFGLGNSCVTQS